MRLIASLSKEIAAAPDAVWSIVSDIPNAASVISGIKEIEIHESATGPDIVGTKWKETREWMGQDAVETMWITDARAPAFYETRAESHGCIYQSRLELEQATAGTRLTMQFRCQPMTLGAKVLWVLTGWMAKRSIRKIIDQDLEDIKAATELRR